MTEAKERFEKYQLQRELDYYKRETKLFYNLFRLESMKTEALLSKYSHIHPYDEKEILSDCPACEIEIEIVNLSDRFWKEEDLDGASIRI